MGKGEKGENISKGSPCTYYQATFDQHVIQAVVAMQPFQRVALVLKMDSRIQEYKRIQRTDTARKTLLKNAQVKQTFARECL